MKKTIICTILACTSMLSIANAATYKTTPLKPPADLQEYCEFMANWTVAAYEQKESGKSRKFTQGAIYAFIEKDSAERVVDLAYGLSAGYNIENLHKNLKYSCIKVNTEE